MWQGAGFGVPVFQTTELSSTNRCEMKLQTISLRRSEQLSEKWVQDQIADDPSILSLGDLILRDKERPQPGAGRLDLLLQDPETLKRYEVEIQLGATDESHIIRTIEYWDIEKRRYPQYEHAAVIVAEDITSRFLNVIQLFNGHIPLIALKMTAYKVGEEYALTFVKVLDELSFGFTQPPSFQERRLSCGIPEKDASKPVKKPAGLHADRKLGRDDEPHPGRRKISFDRPSTWRGHWRGRLSFTT